MKFFFGWNALLIMNYFSIQVVKVRRYILEVVLVLQGFLRIKICILGNLYLLSFNMRKQQ